MTPNQIEAAVQSLHTRGEYPSKQKVEAELGRCRGTLKADEIVAWHEAMKKFGITISRRGLAVIMIRKHE